MVLYKIELELVNFIKLEPDPTCGRLVSNRNQNRNSGIDNSSSLVSLTAVLYKYSEENAFALINKEGLTIVDYVQTTPTKEKPSYR